MANNSNIFPRLPHGAQATSDIYDKLAYLIGKQSETTAAVQSNTTTITEVQTSLTTSGGGGGSSTTSSGYADIPSLTTVPSNNPTTGAPYAVDGTVIQFAPSSADSGVLFRYTGNPTYAWAYMNGVLYRTQSQLTALAGLLGTVHTNLLVWVTDYAHMLQWTGSVWQRGPGDPEHSDNFYISGSVPSDTGWHALDGSSNVKYLKYDGTTGTRNLPNITGIGGANAFPEGASSYSATVNAATAPTFSGNSLTPAGTVSQPTFTGSPSGSTNVLNTGGSTAVVPAPFTPAGTVSQPTFSGTPVTPAGTISLPNPPVAYFTALLYYRQ